MPQAIKLVETWETERPVDLNALIHDAWRFTSAFALGAISDCTPHIYVSMLPFWPDSSPLSKCYAKYTRRMIQTDGTAIEQRQLALLATWNLSDTTYASAFSPDGTQIAVGVGAELMLLNSSTGRALLPPFRGHSHVISSAQFSPDGTRIASGSYDGVIVWSAQTGGLIIGPLSLEEISNSILSIAFSRDGTRIVSGSSAGKIYIWDANNGRRVLLLDTNTGYRIGRLVMIKYSPDGQHIVSYNGRKILIWDAHEGQVLRVLGSDNSLHSFIHSADFSADGTRIASGSTKGRIYLWDYGSGEIALGPLLVPGAGAELPVNLVSFALDDSHLISGSQGGTICIWDTQTGDLSFGPLEGYTNLLTSVCFSPDGAYFASISELKILRLWDTKMGVSMSSSPEGHINSIASVGFSPDGTRIVSGSYNQTICMWDAESGEITLGPLEGYGCEMQTLLSPDGTRIVSTTNQSVVFLDAHTGDVTLGPFPHHSHLQSVEVSPDGTCIVLGSYDGIIRLLAADTGQNLMVIHIPQTDDKVNPVPSSRLMTGGLIIGPLSLEEISNFILTIAFSRDGTRIVSGSSAGKIYIWDANNGRRVLLLDTHTSYRIDISVMIKYSPDGKHIVSYNGRKILIWDAHEGHVLRVLGWDNILHSFTHSADFSADGTRIASGSTKGRIYLWDYGSGKIALGALLVPGAGAELPVNLVSFALDDSHLISGSQDGTICIWDTQTGDLSFGPLEGYTNLLTSVCFSPDGAYFASISELKILRLWDTKMGVSMSSSPEGHVNSIASVGFSPDGTRIVSGSYNQTICMWGAESGEITLGPLEGYGYMQTLLSPDGTRIVSATNQSVVFLDAHTGDVTLGPFPHHSHIQSVEVSPDGTCIVLGSYNGIIRLLAADTGQNLMAIHIPQTDDKVNGVWSITCSPDGARIAVGWELHELSVYDVHNGKLICGPFTAYAPERNSVRFSPDSTRIVYSTGSSLVVKDVQSGAELLELPETDMHTFRTRFVEFSPDGCRIGIA
ncbi:hypothetical protein RSAG8_07726, partial [Rhizoctonia solani AG-8 WAC10335]